MLPASRNRTYTDDTPVNAGDLNDLQDAIVSAKHGTLSLAIWASAFVGKDVVYDESIGYSVTTVSSTRYATAPILLPAGRRLLSVEFWYNRAGSGTVTPRVLQKRLSTGAQINQWSGAGDTTGSAIESQTVSPNHTLVAGDAYVAQIVVDNIANQILGAKVTFDAP